MEINDITTLLPKLGIAIDTTLAAWEAYLDTLSKQPTYESIISQESKEVSTKVKALLHLLEDLPLRHAALVQSYCDNKLSFIELSDQCADLLQELQKPESEVDLEEWFSKALTGKKFVKEVATLENEIRDEEQGRLQELRRLHAIQTALMGVLADGELGVKEIEALLEAMEAIGVSLAGSGAVNEETEPME